ncbi:GntR family transcriptional regulator [Variovorax defluvii]|uniref:GntR family transcriptional regulator n=1 Tax=Variovorax defluvii TaxID=913761 RepID=A0ABP8I1A7_9BURK
MPLTTPQPLLHTLPLQVAEHLGARIIEGAHAPGSRLREIELAESFDVSRATIREALRLLEQRGLVRILPQRGAHVTQLSAKELDDLFEVRASLLATGSRIVAERCTAAEAATLRSVLERLRQCVDDVNSYSRTSAELVHILVHMSGNEVLASYCDDFALRIGRYARMGLMTAARRRRSISIWSKLISAITHRDGAAAAALHAQLSLENRTAALDEFKKSQAGGQQPPSPPVRGPRKPLSTEYAT